MKIYTDAVGAPNPKRLRVYCAEKGLNLPRERALWLKGHLWFDERLNSFPARGR